MTGPELATLATEVNGGDSIGDTLLFQLLNIARTIVEKRRPWMLLRRTDTSKTVQASSVSAWQTGIDLSTITRFARFYDSDVAPIRLFDGNRTYVDYWLKPFEDRLRYIDRPNTACFDENTKTLYLNGNIQFAGTLYITHIIDSGDVENSDASSWAFPSYAHPLLAFMAVAINKGGIDFDDINARMAPNNQAVAQSIMGMLEKEDNEKQLSSIRNTDPYQDRDDDGYRSGAINI